MKRLILIASLFSTSAFGEIKPTGTILLDSCGHLNKSVQLCTAHSVGQGNSYLVLTGFAYRNDILQGDYFPAEATMDHDYRRYVYKATVIVRNYPYAGEAEYILKIRYASDGTALGDLYVNGTLSHQNIIMESIAHTESL